MRGHGLLPLDPVLGTLAAVGPVLAVSALSWIALERPIVGWARQRNARARDERRVRERRRPASASGSGGVDRRAGGREVSTVRS
jgi:peptidoglycan/LPS O-acetylase OafA/YrhL